MNLLCVATTGFWGHWGWPVLQFVVGLGLVVFFHELGHFLVAKRVGIRVDRFAIGFGPRLAGFKRGQTEYCICAVPLGGYVAMAGQEDFGPQERTADPQAFCNKSIGARLAVISAGVVMNVLFAALLFIVVGLIGKDFPAPVVRNVVEDMPAARAEITWDKPLPDLPDKSIGLRGGDRILKVQGPSVVLRLSDYRISTFQEVAMAAALADGDDEYTFTIERKWSPDGPVRTGKAVLGVQKVADGSRYAFGISQAYDNVLADKPEWIVSDTFQPGDRILAVDGKPIDGAWQIDELAENLTGDPVEVTVQRGSERIVVRVQPILLGGSEQKMILLDDATRLYGRIERKDDKLLVTLQDGSRQTIPRERIVSVSDEELLEILGMVPRLRVLAVNKKLGPFASSPAASANIQPGDVIVAYGDRGAPTWRQMLDINDQAAGSETQIVVLRNGRKISSQISPRKHKGRALVGIRRTVEICPAVVAAVKPGSPADRAGIKSGMVIEKVNGRAVSSWIDVYRLLKDSLGQQISLTGRIGDLSVELPLGRITKEQFDPRKYTLMLPIDLPFEPLTVKIRKSNPVAAVGWGCRETLRMVLSTYVSLRSMIMRNVSPKTLTGPLGIGQMAIQAGRRSPVDLVYFMAFISAAIAVFNFLPLPVLDGGHALFLVIEKIRGRPLPLKVMNFIQIAGLVFLVGLFLAITWQDIARLL